MGSCGSKGSVVYAVKPALEAYKPQFLAMGITQSKLTIFHQHFKTIDKSNRDVITVPQMVEYFGFGNNEFIRKAFGVLAVSRGKLKETLDFRDYVITLWNYCSLSVDDFGLFVFGVYDFDGNKELDHEEAVELMKDLYGSEKKGGDFEELTNRILKQKKMGKAGVQEHFFKQYCQKHPNFLLPATKMQQALKKKIIGDKWWTKTAFEQRQDLCDFEFETVKSLASRLKKDKYDHDVEVNNLSETSSQEAERQKEEEIQRKYNEFKGIVTPTVVAPIEVNNTEIDSDEEREEDEKARRKSRKSKKDLPVAMTSTKRRASLASQSSIGSTGSFEGSPRVGSLKRQRSVGSMGSRQSSFKSLKSIGD